MQTNPPDHLRLSLKQPVRLPDEKPPAMSDPRYCFFDDTDGAEEETALRRQSYYRESYGSRGFHEMMGRLGARLGLVFAAIYTGAIFSILVVGILSGSLNFAWVFSWEFLQMLVIYPFIACLRPLIFLVTIICAVWIYVNDNEDFDWADFRLPVTILVIIHAFSAGTMI